jgi:hypothetical protein
MGYRHYFVTGYLGNEPIELGALGVRVLFILYSNQAPAIVAINAADAASAIPQL